MRTVLIIVVLVLVAAGVVVGLLWGNGKSEPQSVDDPLSSGEAYLLELNYEQALVQFLKAIEVEPRNPRVYTGMAEVYAALGQPDQAILILQEGLQAVPHNAEMQAALDCLLPPEHVPDVEQASTPPPSPSIPDEIVDALYNVKSAFDASNDVDVISLMTSIQKNEFVVSHSLVKVHDFVIHGEYQIYYLGWTRDGTGRSLEMNADHSGGFGFTWIDMVDNAFTGDYEHKRYEDSNMTNHRHGVIQDGQMVLPCYEDFYGGIMDGVYVFSDDPHHVQFDQPWRPYGESFMDDMLKHEMELPNGFVQ